MTWYRVPLALPVLAFALALGVADRIVGPPSTGYLALLVALLLALHKRWSFVVAAACVGLSVGSVADAVDGALPEDVVISRPVTARGETGGAWVHDEFGWRVRFRVFGLRQGTEVWRWRRTVYLYLSGEDVPPSGRNLRVKGYLRQPPPLRNELPQRAGFWSLSVKSGRFVDAVNLGPTVAAPSLRLLRERLQTGISEVDNERVRGVLNAFIRGESWHVDERVRRAMKRLGLAHLFALSGLHVALVGGLAALLLAPTSPQVRVVGVSVAIVGFLAVVGIRPSLLRATLMAVVPAIALLLRRPPQAVNALALAVGAMLLYDPGLVSDLGFRLSASATAGILLGTEPLAATWSLLPRRLARPLAASVCAQLASAVWAWPVFHLINPWAPLLNLLAIPWMTGVLTLSLIWGIGATVLPSGASWFAGLLVPVTAPMEWLAQLPADVLRARPVAWGSFESLSIAGVVYIVLVRGNRQLYIALPLLILPLVHARQSTTNPSVGLTMIDVGQGDAFLLRDGPHTALIDGGGWTRGDIAQRVLLPVLAERGIGRLDLALVTHDDRDHCRGVEQLASYLPIRNIATGGDLESGCLARLHQQPGIKVQQFRPRQRLHLGRWRLDLLQGAAEREPGDDNNTSAVVMVRGFGRSILLTGDIEERAEFRLRNTYGYEALRADVLKVPHHGSKTSTGRPFLAAVRPRVALVSAGRVNRYGHPHPSVIERLHRSGVSIYRTDLDGLVSIDFLGGGRMRIHSQVLRTRPVF